MKSSKLATVTEFRVRISDMSDMDEHFLTKKTIDLLIISHQENYWFIAYLIKSNFELIDGKIQPHTNKIKINVSIRIIPKPI